MHANILSDMEFTKRISNSLLKETKKNKKINKMEYVILDVHFTSAMIYLRRKIFIVSHSEQNGED